MHEANVVQCTVTVGGLTINAGTPIVTLAERIRDLMAENADLRAASPTVPGDAPKEEGASALSEFIRNATPERKAEVYGRVMDRAVERQRATVEGEPAQTVSPERAAIQSSKVGESQ